jgi:hypothetical protein
MSHPTIKFLLLALTNIQTIASLRLDIILNFYLSYANEKGFKPSFFPSYS